jgi:hypothetical protein
MLCDTHVENESGATHGARAQVPDTQAPGIRPRCKHVVFRKLFHRMVQTCNVKEAAMHQLHRMFTPPPVFSPDAPRCYGVLLPEVALTLWAFPSSPDAWSALVKLLVQTIQPRVYVTSETRPAQQEIFLVVNTKLLRSSPRAFDTWLTEFTEHIGMSAGHVCFNDYFDEQMLSSLIRIKKQPCAFRTGHRQVDRDFSLLFNHLSQLRRKENNAKNLTGLDFTVENFAQLHFENKRSWAQHAQLVHEKRSWTRRRSKLAEIISGLVKVNAINVDTFKHMLEVLGELPENAHPETFRLYMAFAQAQNPDEAARRNPLQRPSLLDVPQHPSTQADDLAEAVEHDDNLSDLNPLIGLVLQRHSLIDVLQHPSTQADDLAEAVEHDDNLSDLNRMIGLVVD